MSFRQFGGINYAAKHNIVGSNYNTSNNLLVTQNVGQPNSYIEFLSDISGNINIDISGNIICYGNLYVSQDVDISGNTQMGGNLDVSSNIFIGQNLDVNGNTQMGGNLDVSSNVFIGQNLDVSSNVFIGQNLDVSGNVDISENLTANYMFLSSGNNYSSNPNAVMPKSYIDSISAGLVPAGNVKCILTSGVTSSPATIYPFTTYTLPIIIDGYSVQPGDYVLFNNQGTPNTQPSISNGAYVLNSVTGGYEFYRDNTTTILPVGYDTTTAYIKVSFGDTYDNSGWLQTNRPSTNMYIGTDAIIFSVLFSIDIKAGQGIYLSETIDDTFINVDSSLNFLTLVDASSSNPTLNIGTTNASIINLGKNNATIRAFSGITGPAGSFENLIVSNQIKANGGITGPTGSFENLIVSNQIKANGGITGPTGSFENLIVSNQIKANGVITGYTGSFSYLLSTNNTYLATSSGTSVGIGKNISSYPLDVSGNINLSGSLLKNGTIYPGFTQWSDNGSNIYYNTGNVGIGISSPSYPLDVSGNAKITGQVIAGSFNSTSDYRLKTNIKLLDNYTVDNLRPVEYDINGKHDMGFIAHELQEYYPFLVDGEKDGEKLQSINYNSLIALLVKEIQYLKNEIKELKEK
jgi:hypothetical protein